MSIPFEIKLVLTHAMIGLDVYPQFRRIGIDTIKLHKEFATDFKATGKTDEVAYFLDYGIRVLNPRLNKMLNRPHDHPTFLKMVEYGIRESIEKSQEVWKLRSEAGKGKYFYGCELTY